MKVQNAKILCIGEILWDCYPDEDKPGGAPMNVGIHLKKFGLDVSVFSKVGNDKKGDDLLEFARSNGMDVSLIPKDKDLPTCEVPIKIDLNGNASFSIPEPVAWDNLQINESIEQIIKKTNIIVFGSLASRGKASSETIQKILENNALKILDINLRPPYTKKEVIEPLIHKADIVKLNADELYMVAQWHNFPSHTPEGIVRWMANHYKCQVICVTMGPNGAILYSEGNFYSHEGFRVTAIDTVGAGDAFLAGFVYKYLKKADPLDILSFSCAAGALVASKRGATPDYDISEIENIL